MIRVILGMAQVLAGLALRFQPPQVGTATILEGRLPLLSLNEFALLMVACGVVLLVYPKPRLVPFFLLTLPTLIYFLYTWYGFFLGVSPSLSTIFYSAFYLILHVIYWVFGDAID